MLRSAFVNKKAGTEGPVFSGIGFSIQRLLMSNLNIEFKCYCLELFLESVLCLVFGRAVFKSFFESTKVRAANKNALAFYGY
jgi:hypothetical protein